MNGEAPEGKPGRAARLALANQLLRLIRWIVVLVTLAMAALLIGYGFTRPDFPGVAPVPPSFAIFTFGVALFAPVGALIASRRPRNPIGWIALFVGFLVVANDFLNEYAIRFVYIDGSLPGAGVVAWSTVWIWTVGFGLMGLLMLLFPSGSLPSRRWRPLVWVLIAPSVSAIAVSFSVWGETPAYLINEKNLEADLGLLGTTSILVLFGALALSMVSLLVRYRGSTGDERRQLKWIGYATGVLVTFTVSNVFIWEALGLQDSGIATMMEYAGSFAITAFPLSIGIAVLRHRLYDIDVLIKRTLVYTGLTGTLAFIYLGLVVVLQRATTSFTSGSDLAVAGSTLAVAALFRPARTRIQSFIDRRFYRARYDSRATLDDFSARLRHQVALDSMATDLIAATRATVRPSHASVWLTGDGPRGSLR